MSEREHFSRWRSAEAEVAFREEEDDLFRALAPRVPEKIDVDTGLGRTRVYRWDGAGEPVVFLHGATGTALTWVSYIDELDGRTVYAVDTIGDVGASEQTAPIRSAADLATWLAEVLDGIGIDKAHLAGTSYGGFLALNLAAADAERVRSATLIDPAGVVPLRFARFMLWGVPSLLVAFLPKALRRFFVRLLRLPPLDDPRMFQHGMKGQRGFKGDLLRPEPLTDEQLRAIQAPMLVLIAEKSAPFPAAPARDRLARLAPTAEVEVVANAGHALTVTHDDLVTERMRAFLARVEQNA